MENIYEKAGFNEYVSESKLSTLKELRSMFSDKQNRYIISTYVDFFQAYLLKNGIKIDGSYTNSEIFDDVLIERSTFKSDVNTFDQEEAFMVGEQASTQFKKVNLETYKKKAENISSGKYNDHYKELIKQEKKLSKK